MKLIAVTDRNWMQQELARNERVETTFSYGLDIPKHVEADAWWIPQSPATRFQLSGMRWHLQSPGPDWMSELPLKYSGRDIYALTLAELAELPHDRIAHIKFAEAKSEVLQAKVQSVSEVLALLSAVGTPGNSVLQVSETLELGDEWRFWVLHSQIVAGSRYLHRADGVEHTYYDLEEDRGDGYDDARALAEDVALKIDGPAGYVLDVALTAAKQPLVIEANPAWCAAWYGSEINAVVDTVVAANKADERWTWRPDASLIYRHERQRKLALPQA